MDFPMDADDERVVRMMMEKTHAKTPEDFIKNAITLYGWAIETVEKGEEVARLNEGKQSYRVLQMPALQHVAENQTAESFVAKLEAEYRSSSLARAIEDLDPDNEKKRGRGI